MTLEVTNYAVDVTLAGIVIVFTMLILLVIIIKMFGKLMSGVNDKPTVAEEKPVAPVVVNNAASVSPQSTNDDELIAVISAAVYSMYEGTGVKPVIKAIRPNDTVNPWKFAGIQQNIKSFF